MKNTIFLYFFFLTICPLFLKGQNSSLNPIMSTLINKKETQSSQNSDGILKRISIYENESQLKRLYDSLQVPIVIVGKHIYIPSSKCIELNTLFGDKEDKTLGGDIEDKTLGGDTEDKTLGGDTEDKTLGGDTEDKTLGGDTEDKTLGGDTEDKTLGGDTEDKTLGGDTEDKTLGGDIEDKTLGGDKENEILKGSTIQIACVKTSNSSFKIMNFNTNATIMIYDLLGLRNVDGNIIEYY